MMWIDINSPDQSLPLETDILVKHPHGIEAIHFFSGRWSYWYSAREVDKELLKKITHWCDPKNIK